MAFSFPTLPDVLNHSFDAVIDVRSPAEFAQDHIPGAINLPALTNAERAEVGTIYVQDSPFKARKIGAAMVARNVAAHLDGPLASKTGEWRPLVYCWRGGQRSGSVASILHQIGWRAETIEGGYQTFRSLVHDTLYSTPLPHRFVLLDGNTGTGKTDILRRAAGLGAQVLDLEALANHRGSLLGAQAGGQPSQKAFETALAVALTKMDPARPILVEAESSKVGARMIPPSIWGAMKTAKRITLDAPLEARSTYLECAYADLMSDKALFAQQLERLRKHRGPLVDDWLALLASGDTRALAASLMQDHYDRAYAKSRARAETQPIAQINAAALDPDTREELAKLIVTQGALL